MRKNVKNDYITQISNGITKYLLRIFELLSENISVAFTDNTHVLLNQILENFQVGRPSQKRFSKL